jgi:hypothetical protein
LNTFETFVSELASAFHEVPQVALKTPTGLVEMKNKKTMMVLALVIFSAITMTTWGVQASGNNIGQYTKANTENVKANNQVKVAPQALTNKVYRNTLQKNQVQLSNTAETVKKPEISDWAYTIDDLQLEEVDDKVFAEIYARAKEYENLPEEERKPHIPGVWVVVARGLSWETDSYPETSEVAPEGIPMGMRFFAKAIWGNTEWTLYKLGRGVVGHSGERHRVDGYALYEKETGRFYLVLDGEGVNLQAVGKVYGPNTDLTSSRCRRCLRLAIKGRMSIDGDGYVFGLRGYAYRIPILRAKSVEEVEPQIAN